MKRKHIVLVVVLIVAVLIITGAKLANYNSYSSAAITESSALQRIRDLFTFRSIDREKVLCARDANGNGSIQFSDPNEWTIKEVTNCIDNGGAPGLQMIVGQIPDASISKDLDSKTGMDNVAALYSVIGNSSDNINARTQIQYQSGKNHFSSQLDISGNIIAAITLRNLLPGELSSINADRVRSGITSKKYKRGVYECTDFSRDLEKSNPTKYTVTVAYCRVDVKCTDRATGTKKSYRIIGGHVFNDVHSGSNQLSYVEPQTGNNIDPDLDGDGKASNGEIFNINGVSEQIDNILNERAPGCTDAKVTYGPKCTLKSYENMVDAYQDLPANFFNPGFNPN